MVLPFVEVSHLPQSTSFYSSVLQPLGLRYLSADREQPSSIGTVTYGYKPGALGQDRPLPILQLREAAHPLAPLKLSSLVLTAPSHDAVVDFHACGLDANPWLRIQQNDDGSPAYPGPSGRPRLGIDGGVSRATICDLDGNMMEVVYPPPSGGSRPPTYNGVPIRQTQSNRHEAVRILDWDYDVAARSARAAASHHSSTSSSHRSQTLTQLPVRPRYPSSRPGPAGSVVSAAMSQHAPSLHADDAEPLAEPSISPRQSSTKSSLNTTNVVGALLGVAAGAMAGAALTYGMVNKEKERRPRHEQDHPMLPRRSTYPEKIPRAPHHSDRHSAYDEYPPRTALPYPQQYDYGRPRAPYQEDYPLQPLPYPGQFAPEPAPYHDDYAPRTMPNCAPRTLLPVESSDESTSESEYEAPPEPHRRPVRYLTEKSHHSTAPKSATRSTARSVARSRAPVVDDEDEVYDTRSRHSSKHKSSRAPSMRPRSEAPVSRALTIHDEGRRSRAASRPPKSTHSQARSRRPSYDHERDSYFSAKSRRSGATSRPQPPPAPELVEQEIVTRSRSGSRVTTTKLAYQQGRPVMVDRSSKAPSRVSARNIQLPTSNIGSSHANWDDDMESVAPSDSISCIGSKTSRRSRRARA